MYTSSSLVAPLARSTVTPTAFIEQCHDRDLVTDLGAGGELRGDFDRQRPSFEQDNGGLAVEGAAGGDRDADADGLAVGV